MEPQYQKKLQQIGVEVEQVLARFMGNEKLYLKFLLRLPEDENYKVLLQAMEQKDVHRAFQAAHTLKGVCGNLSLQPLYEQFGELTELLRNGKIEQAVARKPVVDEMWAETMSVLKEWQP